MMYHLITTNEKGLHLSKSSNSIKKDVFSVSSIKRLSFNLKDTHLGQNGTPYPLNLIDLQYFVIFVELIRDYAEQNDNSTLHIPSLSFKLSKLST